MRFLLLILLAVELLFLFGQLHISHFLLKSVSMLNTDTAAKIGLFNRFV